MPTSPIIITSSDFVNDGLINTTCKNSLVGHDCCNGNNLSPQLSWSFTAGHDTGILQEHIESYSLYVYENDLITPNPGGQITTILFGSGNSGDHVFGDWKSLWKVEDIDPASVHTSPTEASIPQNVNWSTLAGTETIFIPTDNFTNKALPDAPNGWSGPCSQESISEEYVVLIRANIKLEFQSMFNLSQYVNSQFIVFRDHSGNCAEPTVGIDCFADPGDCCYIITNCQDYDEQYQVQFDPAALSSIIYGNIYNFAGDGNLNGWASKCFRLEGLQHCNLVVTTPIVTGVTINDDYGETSGDPGGCEVCLASVNPCHEFEDCSNPGTFRYYTFGVGAYDPAGLVIGNLYYFWENKYGDGRLFLEISNGCWRYKGESGLCTNVTEITNLTIGEVGTSSCDDCLPCLQFRNCDTNADIFIKLSNQGQGGLDQRQIDKITITGTSGSIFIQVGGFQYTLTFNTDPTTTAADFVSINAATILSLSGVIVTSVGNEIFLESAIQNQTFGTGALPSTGNLDGFAEDVQLNEFIAGGLPTLLNVYDLQGDPAIEGVCWEFRGELECLGDPDYTGITIKRDYDCANCIVCIPYYKLTDCADPQNILDILWDRDEIPLDEDSVYIFDFAPDTCFTPELQYNQCEYVIQPPVYDATDITTTYVDCVTCNQLCYRLIDCETFETIQVILPTDMSMYVGKIIKWVHSSAAFAPIERCALVEIYLCRAETYTARDITILECGADSCEDCLPQDPVPPPLPATGRPVEPGYDVPDCTN